ncbi:MAG: hypothetical protein PUD39_04760 [Bacteroidales bacterium]|nr:hypothetical protein [Bacteroidales bacterium]
MYRMLATEVMWHGYHRCSMVTFEDGIVDVCPFEKELHSTTFIAGMVAILDASKLDEYVLDDIEMMVGASGAVNDKKKLDDYLESSSLYYCNGNSGKAVFLKVGNPCQIIPTN